MKHNYRQRFMSHNKEKNDGYLTSLEAIAALERVANDYSDGCFSIIKSRDGWKCMLGTLNYDKESERYIDVLEIHETLIDTITKTLWIMKKIV